jgi:hypothetical protein
VRAENKKTGSTSSRRAIINPIEQRKRFLLLAAHLRNGKNLTDDQSRYLASAFEKIGNGESADKVFHLKRGQGQTQIAEKRRTTMSLVFAQVAHYMSPKDGFPPGEGLNLNDAMEKVVPLARSLFSTIDNPDSYSMEYLLKCWHDPSYAHMRTTYRTALDPDSPFAITQ